MSRTGENIYKRKDGRWEGRYIKSYDSNKKALYGYVYARTYTEVKQKLHIASRDSVLGQTACHSDPSLSTISRQWEKLYSVNWKPGTRSKYEYTYHAILWKHTCFKNVKSTFAGFLFC